MKMKSVKAKILGLVLISIFVSFSILGFYNAKSNYDAQYNLIKQKEINLAKQTSKFINSYLQSKIDIIDAVAKEITNEQLNINNKDILSRLALGEIAGGFVNLYIGFENDGSLILANGDILNIEKNKFDSRVRPWYKEAININKSGVSSPYVDTTTKKLVVSIFTPLKVKGKVIGVLGSDIFIDTIVETVLNVKIDGMGSSYLVREDGKTIIHKNKELLEKENQVYKQIKTDKDQGFAEALDHQVEKLVSYSTIPITKWKLLIQLDKETIFQKINDNVIKEIILYIVLLSIIVAIIFFALSKLLKPIKTVETGLNFFFRYLKGEESNISKLDIKTNDEFSNMAEMINKEMQIIAKNINQDNSLIDEVKNIVHIVSEGYLDKRIEQSASTKSLNELKTLLNDMLNHLEEIIGKDLNKITEVFERYTHRDFTAKLDSKNSGKIGEEIIRVNEIITQILTDNKKDGLTLQNSADELTANVNTLSNNATSQASSLEETAASIDEITSNIEQTSQKAQEMLGISNDTKNSATNGKDLANQTVKAMEDINNTVININEAISVIDQIAFQTNILSLNAAVEAATAGEAGKGFAVVAQEVRNLASRSAEAAKEIKELVESATVKANSGKGISSSMIEGFTQLEEKIMDTAKLIDDVTNAAKEQSIGMTQIADAVGQLDQFTQENASIADKTNTIAQETNSIAQDVVAAVDKNSFEGKESIKVEKKVHAQPIQRTQPKTVKHHAPVKKEYKEEKPKKVAPSKPAAAVKEQNDNDEWESF